MSSGDRVPLDLLRKYDRPGPRYTSYPTAVEFHEEYGAAEYASRLAEADRAAVEPLSLYVHLPFCHERCAFCGCNVVIARDHQIADRYLGYLAREVGLLARHLPNRRRVSQYHWGGGTPTYLSVDEIFALQRKVSGEFSLGTDAEVAIEVDPRVTTQKQLAALRELGFNRISLGVQDLTPEVQCAIHRHQTEDQTRRLYEDCRTLGFESINLDLIYGLPRQALDSFDRTLDVVLDLRPDRVALYSYAHLPKLRPNQKGIDPADLPAPEVKLQLYGLAVGRFLGAGYTQIGMDHFAVPEDELARAVGERRLARNFMGYTVKKGSDLVGVGTSAIAEVRGSFAQNERKLSRYYAALDRGELPVERGYVLDADDRVRQAVIGRLMCNFHLDCREIESAFGIDFGRYFTTELAELGAPGGPVDDDLLDMNAERLEVRGYGRLFIRSICMIFDRHLREGRGRTASFSRTV